MKKCILFIYMLFGITINAISQVQPTDTDGDGYINISTLEHLRWVSENSSSWANNFELDNNINAAVTANWNSGAGFSPIGIDTIAFTGKFEGNGFAIDSLYINRPETDYVGLFRWTDGADISNVGITNCRIIGKNYVGGLVGDNNNSTVSNCYSTGNISSTGEDVGGLIGRNFSSTVSNCYSSSSVSGNRFIGGLVGANNGSTLSICYSISNVNGIANVGGLVGWNYASTVINSYSTGKVTSSICVGGLVGRNSSSTVSNCYSTGAISGSDNVGGLIGEDKAYGNNATSVVSNSFWDKQTSGIDTSAGGVGKTTAEMKIKNTYTDAGWNFDLVWSIDSSMNNGYPYINDRGISNFFGIEPIDTDGDGYRNISCYSHLHWVSKNASSWSWNFELDNNIAADSTRLLSEGLGFTPIGNIDINFTGKFEGNGFAIDSLYINRPSTFRIGLFGMTSNAEIANIGIVNSRIIGNDYSGGLIGLSSHSVVSKCYSSGSFSGSDYIGGLIGKNSSSSKVSNCYSTCRVSGGQYVGGLVGYNYVSTVSISYSTGNVSGSEYLGGLIGKNSSSSKVSNCYSSGSVSGGYYVGGLVGGNDDYSTVSNCYSTGYVFGNIYIGGLVGRNNQSIVGKSFWDTQTSGIDTSASGTGKTTAEMKTEKTFINAGWNFTLVWSIDPAINKGYPYINYRGYINMSGIEPIDTDGDGYRNISCYSHLHWISINDSSWAWNYELDNNINADSTRLLSGDIGFCPIGNSDKEFSGKFEGNGFAIDSLYINRQGNYFIGFFGATSKAEISNIGLINCQVNGGSIVGGLVGANKDSSTVSNSYSTGSIFGADNYVGGLVGDNVNYSTLSNCYSMGNVLGNSAVGGLVGYDKNSTIRNCYSADSVSGDRCVGGLVGENDDSMINNCYSTCNITANSAVGGIAGYNSSSTVSNCYSRGSVSGKSSVGGIAGYTSLTTVSNCYSTGRVSDGFYAGGLVGLNNESYRVVNSFWDIQTSGLNTSHGGTGKTTAEMKTKSTFVIVGWDFDTTWAIAADYNDGYPNLDGKNDPNGIVEYHALNSKVYPQPASDELFVRLPESTEAAALVKLYDQAGQTALMVATSVNSGVIRLNTANLNSGVYRMLIRIDGKTYSEKVIVAK